MSLHEVEEHRLLDMERLENDVRYAAADVSGPLQVEMHPKSWECWHRYVGSVEGKRVLDVGCGSGLWTVWLASRGATVVGIDVSPIGVARTLERSRAHGLEARVSAYCVDAGEIGTVVAADSIDLVLGFSVLHHLPVDICGPSLKMVLKRGGMAVFFENSAANPLYRLGRRIRNAETAAGPPLTADEARALIAHIGTGELVFPHFKLFDAVKKYMFRNSAVFAALLQGMDDSIDLIPGMRRWSAGMWVVARKMA